MITDRRILLISPFESWPLSQGSIVRTHYLAKQLCQHNRVWLACREGDEQVANLPLAGVLTNGRSPLSQLFSPRFLYQLYRLVQREKIDLILATQIWSGWHGWLLARMTRLPLLFDNHNVEYLRLRRMGSVSWPLVGLLELLLCHTAVQTVVVSETDREYLIRKLRLPADRLQVAVNGADVARLQVQPVDRAAVRQQLGLSATNPMVLFFGSLTHQPNATALELIRQELSPRLLATRPEIQLVAAGMGHPAYQQQLKTALPANLHLVGFVADMTAVIKAADLIIVPLTAGSGTRFKIIESIACGRRVVSTRLGAEGLSPAVLGEGLVVVDGWDRFTEAIVMSLAQPVDCPPPAAFIEQYDWSRIFNALSLPPDE